MNETGRSGDGQRSKTAEETPAEEKPVAAGDGNVPPAPAMPHADAGAPPLPPDIQSRIGTQLQMLYADLLTQETPDRFLRLLDDLDRKSRQG